VRGPVVSKVGAEKRSLNLTLTVEVVQKIKALALLRRVTVSELVTGWAEHHCKGLILAVRIASSSSDPGDPPPESPPADPRATAA
jgi:hypothetical protein